MGAKNLSRVLLPTLFMSFVLIAAFPQESPRSWLAGDSHIHSHWSPDYDRTKSPPEPIIGADASYSTPTNAQKAREYGLSWMVTTDHGGPNHSKLNLIHAYAELTESRRIVPEVLQFYGMELNMPAMDHHTLIIPNMDDEWRVLFNIESQFDKNEVWPADPSRDSEAAATKALLYMNTLRRIPLLFANHPSRSASGVGQYGLDEPREFRSNNDTSPDIYRGMEGAPGHQAAALAPDGSPKVDAAGLPSGNRGSYGNSPTLGGFDQMTAILGGLWDSLLGEGRRFWIVATSDSHSNYADPNDPGSDFWPGQYQKTYVKARKNYGDILDGLRNGRIFVVAGDLVSELDVTVQAGGATAGIGETLETTKGSNADVTIRFRVPGKNAHGDIPRIDHVDLITGEVRGLASNRNLDKNDTTKVNRRFFAEDWSCSGDTCTIRAGLGPLDRNMYLRIRGTNTSDAEPTTDAKGENPWSDLWFYSNPIFVEVR